MQDESYFKVIGSGSVVCLKLPLRKFSIGHYLLLSRARSPFILGDRAPSFRDLLQAVLICSSTFEEARDIDSDVFARLKIWIWGKRILKADFLEEHLKFREYLAAGTAEPKVRPGNGRAYGSPWLLRLKQFLVFRLRLSESDAWNYPYADAVWEYCAYYESEGACEVRNAHDLEFLKWVEEEEALEAAKTAKEKEKPDA